MAFPLSKSVSSKSPIDTSTILHDDHLDFFFLSLFKVLLTSDTKLFVNEGSNLLAKDFNKGLE